MNFENLVVNLQEEEKKRESQILPYCDPKQIANELMRNLESGKLVDYSWTTSTGYHVEVGSLYANYSLWYISKPREFDPKGSINGPLGNCNDKYKLAQVVLDLVKKYITDDMIRIGLDGLDDNTQSLMNIDASISRANVDKIKSMNSR